jgi:peroxidase
MERRPPMQGFDTPIRALVVVLVASASVPALAQQPWGYELNLLEHRTYDGSANSIGGVTHHPLLRMGPANFPDDGSGSKMWTYPDRENPRVISNRIVHQGDEDRPNDRRKSDYLWAWGQFLDHDLDLTEVHPDNGIADIAILDPEDILGPAPILFTRSNYAASTGTGPGNPRQQVNEITAFIDASNVYGSDDGTAAALRTVGGRLATSDGNLLPIVGGMFLAGDLRSNENVMLTSLHTLFVREHNRLAGLIELLAPEADDEQIYQTARKIVGYELQLVTYQEFLPALLGHGAPRLASLTYDSSVDPSIATEFSTAFFRFGHSLLSPHLMLAPIDGSASTLALRDAFFQPHVLINDPLNVDRLLAGATLQQAQEVDNLIVDDVRNFLFGPPGAGGLDLAALNIQRGRDHGLSDYNTLRAAYGLSPVERFRDISRNRNVRQALEDLYGNVDNIDAWVGGLAEDHVRGSSVGELIHAALFDQFSRVIRGDRMSILSDPDVDSNIVGAAIHLDRVTLADIIRSNTVVSDLPDDVFSTGRTTTTDVIASYNRRTDRVHVTGNAEGNRLSIIELPFGVLLTGQGSTRINGRRTELLISGRRPHLTVNLGAGQDELTMLLCEWGDCVVSLGDQDDALNAYFCRAKRLAVEGGDGIDTYNDGITTPEDLLRVQNLP